MTIPPLYKSLDWSFEDDRNIKSAIKKAVTGWKKKGNGLPGKDGKAILHLRPPL